MTKTTKTRALTGVALLAVAMGAVAPAWAADATLTIESWRNDDLQIWQDKIIPAFEKSHPGIKLNYQPTAPKEYNAALNSKLDAGTAGDIIACRPFDASLELFKKGQLTSVNDIPGMNDFGPVAKAAWSTDDGKTTFCVPVAAVLHGFIYNKDAFKKVGITAPPKTSDEFFADLDKIKKDGTYVPLAMGTPDQWEPRPWATRTSGRITGTAKTAARPWIAGTEKLTDPEWVAPFTELAKWGPYMGDGYKAQSYPDSQNMFTLGRAAIYPAGSWEISQFDAQAQFPMGAFPAPVPKAGDPCYLSDHVDIAFGVNAKTKQPEAAKALLTWMASPDFAKLYSNALPASSACRANRSRPKTRWPKSLSHFATAANQRSARPTRSCRAARRISKTRPGSNRRTSSTAPIRRKSRPRSCKKASTAGITRRSESPTLLPLAGEGGTAKP